MVEVLARKRLGALRPEADEAVRVFSRIPEGTQVVVDVRDHRRRSGEQMRYWFALLNLAWENSEALQRQCGTFENFRHLLLIELGYCTPIQRRDGSVVRIAKSVSFAKMDSAEFGALVDATLDWMEENLGFDPELLRQEAAA